MKIQLTERDGLTSFAYVGELDNINTFEGQSFIFDSDTDTLSADSFSDPNGYKVKLPKVLVEEILNKYGAAKN